MIEENFSYFIKFGRVLNEELRKKLVEYFFSAIIKKKKLNIEKKNDKNKLNPFINYIDTVANIPNLQDLCINNPEIIQNLSTDFFNNVKNIDKNLNLNNPFQEEIADFQNWKNTEFKNPTEIKQILENMHKYYDIKRFNFEFFEKEIEVIDQNQKLKEKQIHKKEAIVKEIIERWNALIEQKKNLLLIKKIDEERKKFCKNLYEQVEKFLKLQQILEPFTNECGRLWDLSKGMWKNIGFNILEKYAEMLEKEPELKNLAEMLGRMHQAEDELEEQEIQETIIKPYKKIIHAGKSELVGIHESNDINNLLPVELTLLNDPITELVFYKKFAEKKLLSYRFIGYDWVNKKEDKSRIEQVAKKNIRGPIIICVDTSGSMHGTPEYVAKVLCFAILRIALLEKRKCFLISFSTRIKTLELTDLNQNLPTLIEFLTYSFHGGTDPAPALEEAIRQVHTKNYNKADVLMISDFIMARVANSIEKSIEKCKEKGTRFHSLVISSVGNPQVLQIFDNNWIYAMEGYHAFKPVLKNIRYINSRNTT